MSEPMRVLPLEYATGSTHPLRWHRTLRMLSHAAWITCLIATLLIVIVSVETVLVTGPLIFLLGTMLLLFAINARSTPHMIFAATQCAICLLFVMLVQLFHLGPQEATVPFAIMGAIYTAVSVIMVAWIQFSLRARANQNV